MKNLFLSICMLFFFATSALAGININTADQQSLESLPGIGVAKAKAIIEYRAAHGDFASLDDLAKVKGIGEKVLAKIKEMIEI